MSKLEAVSFIGGIFGVLVLFTWTLCVAAKKGDRK